MYKEAQEAWAHARPREALYRPACARKTRIAANSSVSMQSRVKVKEEKGDDDERDVGLCRGSCEGRCWGSTPRFSSFCAPGYAPPSGGHSPASASVTASILRHWRGPTRIHHSTRAVTECPGLDSTSQFVPTRLARIRPDPNRHQAWDDLGLGTRRSGVLPSHARRNGSLPIPCMGGLSYRCSVSLLNKPLWWVCLRVNTDYRHWVSDLRSPPVSG